MNFELVLDGHNRHRSSPEFYSSGYKYNEIAYSSLPTIPLAVLVLLDLFEVKIEYELCMLKYLLLIISTSSSSSSYVS